METAYPTHWGAGEKHFVLTFWERLRFSSKTEAAPHPGGRLSGPRGQTFEEVPWLRIWPRSRSVKRQLCQIYVEDSVDRAACEAAA